LRASAAKIPASLFQETCAMRTLLIVMVGLTLIPTQDNAAKKDLAAMEGSWTLVSMEVDGKEVPPDKLQGATLTIRGNKYALVTRGKQHDVEITLDAGKTPKVIDMKFLDGPNKDRVGKGIYQLDGNTLKICRGLDPQQERPGSFKTKGQVNYFVMVWQRQP